MWSALHPHLPRGVEVVAEANQGGQMVRAVLHTADSGLKVKLIDAVAGKSDRAAPVAMLFEAGRVTLHGRFPDLEHQLLGLIAGGGYEGPGNSPDRADAMVWALTELMLQPEPAPPRIRGSSRQDSACAGHCLVMFDNRPPVGSRRSDLCLQPA